MTGSNTRVGIPLHSVAIRRIGDVIATEPEFYDRLVEVYPRIDSQRRMWPDFDIEALIELYAKDGFDGASKFINEYIIGPTMQRRARAYVAQFRAKHVQDPFSYPINWLIRNLLLNEINVTSASPIGPGTKAHAVRSTEIVEVVLDES
jgi:hypothetical protein